MARARHAQCTQLVGGHIMRLVDETRKNAPFIGVLFAIMIAGLALVVALVALLNRMG